MRKLLHVAFFCVFASASGSALAAPDEHNGYTEIVAGRYNAAEQVIVKEQRMFRHDADLVLNLAFVYAQTGRAAEARDLYQQVLDRPNETMNVPLNGSAGSHDIARLALRQFSSLQISAR